MIIRPSQLWRVLHINAVLVRHGLDEIVLATHLFRPVRFLLYLAPWNWVPRKREPRGVRIRRALEDLGPIFVKFGQIISTRQDLLPEDIANELTKLQDQVPPFPGELAREMVEKALGQPVQKLFQSFQEIPLASASIAQVHEALYADGTPVVVKVLRPNIERLIRRDVALLKYVAELAERYWGEGPRLRPQEVVAEFEKTLLDELDLLREAANAAQLKRNFAGSSLLYVPEVFWPHCRRNVMVMERISGIPIGDLKSLRAHNVDLKRLSENGVEIFFTQVFSHNFFHADMHPGNIFVDRNGRYEAVDFGIMGTLSPIDQRYLAENFLAFFQRDYRRVAELHVESRWVPPGTRVDEFESAIRTVCEPIFQRPLKEISFGHLLLRLFQTARRFNMEIQPQLVLLQKTLLNIEGLGRQLYPDLDLWQTAKPFLERWMSEQVGTRSFLQKLRQSLPKWGETLPELPELLHRTLHDAAEGKLKLEWASAELCKLRSEVRRSNRRTVGAVLGTGLIIAAAIIYAFGSTPSALGAGVPWPSWMLGGIGALVVILSQRGKFN